MSFTCTNKITGDSDFDSDEQRVPLGPSDNSSRLCVEIMIIDDFIFEGDEQFLVRFGNFSDGRVEVGAIPQACVTIQDNDGQLLVASCIHAVMN